jgi:hypothetical protein
MKKLKYIDTAVQIAGLQFAHKGLIVLLLAFTCHSICLGQVSSYTDVAGSGNSVVGYGAVTGIYGSGYHVNTTSVTLTSPSGASSSASGGDSATVSLSVDQDGNYSASTSHEGTCPYYGYVHIIGGSGGQTQVCNDTCTPCRAKREQQGDVCLGILVACEGAASAKYLADIQSCNNQNYCKTNHPDFNEEQCNTCKNTALEVYGIASAACTAGYGFCSAARDDCSVSTIKTATCASCSN